MNSPNCCHRKLSVSPELIDDDRVSRNMGIITQTDNLGTLPPGVNLTILWYGELPIYSLIFMMIDS